ncbi:MULTISPECIES: hypothetical protein [Actinoplanes]|uniref:hypothetical protein n=1 Tax=Actinoplanes TaxID=1865 RepID=UPI0005F2FADA|nr:MULTISPECIES: hypothetical protein [Actinoplanes]
MVRKTCNGRATVANPGRFSSISTVVLNDQAEPVAAASRDLLRVYAANVTGNPAATCCFCGRSIAGT